MATEYVADPGGLDGYAFDAQAVNLHFGGPWVRGGVVPGSGAGVNPLGYVLSAGLIGTIKAGTYVLAAPDRANGFYEVVVPADVNITHTTANASQPRTDLIIVEVNDVGTSSSTKKVRLLTGTAGSGAPAPTLPTSLGNGAVVAIASVNVPANATTLGTITDLRTYATTPGALFLANAAAASGVPEGTAVYLNDVDRLGFITAAGIKYVHQGKVNQQVASDGVSNGSIAKDGVDHGVTAPTLTVAAGAKVEFDIVVWILSTTAAAGYLNLTLGDQTIRQRWHNQGVVGLATHPLRISYTSPTAATVTATLAVNNDATSGAAVTIPNVPNVFREIL